jgi:type IV fimbrial biogenesis protein FimT
MIDMIRRNLSLFPRRSAGRPAGFSLVELMVSMALVAIGLALAVPSYRDMVEKRQLEQGIEQIAAFINTAQTTASKNNRVVTVSYSRTAADNWCFGAVLGASACDCTESVDSESDYCAIDGAKTVLSSQSTNGLELLNSVTGDGAFTYDQVRGLADDDVELSMVSICSDGSSYKVPGYAVCAVEAVEGESS